MFRKAVLLIFILLCFCTPFAHAKDTAATRSIRILVPKSTSSVPFIILDQTDPIEGVDISVEFFINHPVAMSRLIKGEVDLLFTGTSAGWENHLDGGPVVMVNTGVWGVSYLIGRDDTVKTFADLKGKRIALPFPGSPLDFQTRYLLSASGLDPEKDLVIQYAPFTQSVPLLIAAKIDAAPLPEPLATNVVINKNLVRMIDYKKAWADAGAGMRGAFAEYSPQVSLFTVERSAGTGADPLVLRVTEEWSRVSDWVLGHAAESAARSEALLGFTEPLLKTAIINTLFLVPSFEQNRMLVEDYYNTVKRYLPGERKTLGDSFFFTP
ncbi:MAG: ABC transporter substrate-binding protein [Spirochaetes bacterium]|nr:ABC transporter substrate-binding protein [Spirochaetota bacterium]